MFQKLQHAWVAHELPGFREAKSRSTYMEWDIQKLPPIPQANTLANFNWLRNKRPQNDEDNSQANRWKRILKTYHKEILKSAKSQEIKLPDSYLFFLEQPELLNRLRSCTGCFFTLPGLFPKMYRSNNVRLVHFLQDGQGRAYWYLCIKASGDYRVVMTERYVGGGFDELNNWDEEDRKFEKNVSQPKSSNLCIVEYSFEEFLYRFWIENEIWMELVERKVSLIGEKSEYARHYLDTKQLG